MCVCVLLWHRGLSCVFPPLSLLISTAPTHACYICWHFIPNPSLIYWNNHNQVFVIYLHYCLIFFIPSRSCIVFMKPPINDVQWLFCFHLVILPLFKLIACSAFFHLTFLCVCVCLFAMPPHWARLFVCLCSQKGLKNVFDEAILAALEPPEPKKKRKCVLLWEAPTFFQITHTYNTSTHP